MRYGWIHFDGWAGRTKHRVEILKETPKRFRVRMLEQAYRHSAGSVLLAPKYAVTLEEDKS